MIVHYKQANINAIKMRDKADRLHYVFKLHVVEAIVSRNYRIIKQHKDN